MEKEDLINSILGYQELAQKNFSKWNDALQTKNPEEVAKLYADQATFLPTMSPDFKIGQDGAGNYFEGFLLQNPFGKIVEEKVQRFGNDAYAHTGLYDFEVGPTDKRKIAHARFTFVWQKDENGQWKIAHHHSSLVPIGH